MKLEVYLLKDENGSTIEAFSSHYKASEFQEQYKTHFQMERVEIDIPREIKYKSVNRISPQDMKEFKPLQEVEKEYILYVLSTVNGNKMQAAKILDISAKTLYNKLEEYEINKVK